MKKFLNISIEISPIIREDRDLPVKNSRKRTEKTGTENGEAYGTFSTYGRQNFRNRHVRDTEV